MAVLRIARLPRLIGMALVYQKTTLKSMGVGPINLDHDFEATKRQFRSAKHPFSISFVLLARNVILAPELLG